MAIYAIGDLQGCASAFEDLLSSIKFKPKSDKLWLVGDLVNRGPDSLDTLRIIRGLGDAAITVLGNHDLHLLSVHAGVKSLKPGDTLKPLLKANDADKLMHWLRQQPLLHYDSQINTLLVHAGIYPGWRKKQALALAAEVQERLRGDKYVKLLKKMYGQCPSHERDIQTKWQRYRFTINCLTRMRYLDTHKNLNFTEKQKPGAQRGLYIPWFVFPERGLKNTTIVFGHWSSLGFMQKSNLIALDSGCVWGGKLTAVRLDHEDRPSWQVSCNNYCG